MKIVLLLLMLLYYISFNLIYFQKEVFCWFINFLPPCYLVVFFCFLLIRCLNFIFFSYFLFRVYLIFCSKYYIINNAQLFVLLNFCVVFCFDCEKKKKNLNQKCVMLRKEKQGPNFYIYKLMNHTIIRLNKVIYAFYESFYIDQQGNNVLCVMYCKIYWLLTQVK